MDKNTETHTIEIFKAGTHVAMDGTEYSFSEEDLAATAAAYDVLKHESPVVIGHPRHDDPAYGWVKSLFVQSNVLFAEVQQIDPEFSEMINAGRFKKVSAAFYPPDAANNPSLGIFSLRHVGFLGAKPPAVKGLRSPCFADGGESSGILAFGDWDDRNNAGLWRGFRDWFIGKFGIDEANKAIPAWRVEDLESSAMQPDEPPQGIPNFSETGQEKSMLTPEQLKAENERLKATLAQKEMAEKKAKQEKVRADSMEFAEGLVSNGVLAPKHKEVVVELLAMASTPMADGKSIEFGEGSEKKNLAVAVKELLSDMQPCVAFGEFATNQRSSTGQESNPLIADAEKRAAQSK